MNHQWDAWAMEFQKKNIQQHKNQILKLWWDLLKYSSISILLRMDSHLRTKFIFIISHNKKKKIQIKILKNNISKCVWIFKRWAHAMLHVHTFTTKAAFNNCRKTYCQSSTALLLFRLLHYFLEHKQKKNDNKKIVQHFMTYFMVS